jgi:Bacterial SH3 domain
MRASLYRYFFFLCTLMLFACASAPYKTNVLLEPEPGKLSLSQQDLDYAFNAAIATGLDLGYRPESSSAEQRMVTMSRLRPADGVSESLKVNVESNGPFGNLNVTYQSPKPLQDASVKEFTDRFLQKFRMRQAVAPVPSQPGNGPVESERPLSVARQKETRLILLKNSNIRTEPSIKGKVITTLRKGEKVVKLDESGDWYDVGLPSGRTGWISKSLVKEVD